MLAAGDFPVTCVAPHPHDPILASPGGAGDTVQIWSPSAAAATSLPNLDAVLRRNAQVRHAQAVRDGTVLVIASVIWKLWLPEIAGGSVG